MLLDLLLVAVLAFFNAAYVASKPTSPQKDWEVGHSPLSGYESANLWNQVAPWSSSSEDSPHNAVDSPFSIQDWHDTWFGTPPIVHHGLFDSPSSHLDDIQYPTADHPPMPAAVSAPESSFPGFDSAHTVFQIGSSSQGPQQVDVSRHQELEPPTFQVTTPSNDPSEQTTVHRVPAINPETSPPLNPRMRRLSEMRRKKISASRPQPDVSPPPFRAAVGKKGILPKPRRLSPITASQVRYNLLPFQGDEAKKNLWQQRMRKVLGSEELRFRSAAIRARPDDKVFIADDGHAVQGFYPAAGLRSVQNMGAHFLSYADQLKKQNPRELQVGEEYHRLYVYWNNRAHMDYLNRKYFLNRLRFLPIDQQQLRWGGLNKLHLSRDNQYVLPPLTLHGLPVVVDRHDVPRVGSLAFFSKLTQHSEPGHSISLWSPVLSDGERYTMVLYGIAQIEHEDSGVVLDHLTSLEKDKSRILAFSSYDLADLAKEMH